jgi:hypothetical protein
MPIATSTSTEGGEVVNKTSRTYTVTIRQSATKRTVTATGSDAAEAIRSAAVLFLEARQTDGTPDLQAIADQQPPPPAPAPTVKRGPGRPPKASYATQVEGPP